MTVAHLFCRFYPRENLNFKQKNLKINNKSKFVIFAFQKQICLLVLPATKFSKTGRLDLLLLQFAYYLHIPEHTRSLSGGLLGHKIMP